MSDVRKVTVQISKPVGNDPGRVSFGYFKVTNGVLTMCDPSGKPVLDRSGLPYKEKLDAGADPAPIARMLTRRIMREVTNALGTHASFNGPINYPTVGVA